jgi:hypothetical protein
MQQARGLADKALKIDNEADTHRLLNRALKAAGLNALVRENLPSKFSNSFLRCTDNSCLGERSAYYRAYRGLSERGRRGICK